MMTPLLTDQVPSMDEARMEFATKLNDHILKLREELRINEIILESILRSISTQSETMAELNIAIQEERQGSARHRPMLTANGSEDLLHKLTEVLTKPETN